MKQIPYLSIEKRLVIADMLQRNENVRTANFLAPAINSLMAKGFLKLAAPRGGRFDARETPLMAPMEVWEVFVRERDKFPFPDKMPDRSTSWMAN